MRRPKRRAGPADCGCQHADVKAISSRRRPGTLALQLKTT
jgi:hypothetical protein